MAWAGPRATALPDRAVAAGGAALGQDQLPQLTADARVEAGAEQLEEVGPHPGEPIVVGIVGGGGVALEGGGPGHEGREVVVAEVVPVLDDEHAFEGAAEVGGRREHAVG